MKSLIIIPSGMSLIVDVNIKKAAKLMVEEECKEMVDNILNNKTISIMKQVGNCKPFVGLSILFVSVSIVLTGIMIYFHCKSRNRDVLPY